MTVFLGDSGRIMLIRKGSDQIMYATMNPSDVREDVNRFSIDFAHEQVLTGDRLQISTVGGEDLNWINHPDADKSFTRYVHVDEAGGIRLYDSFSDAIRAVPEKAVDIIKPPSNQRVFFKILSADDEARCLAEVTNYQITTTRETIDTTNLGAYYRKQYEAGLVQGQGRIECLWRKPDTNCDLFDTPEYDVEFSVYLARLCIRLVHGAAFHGLFFIYADDDKDIRSVWYESETCIVSNVAVTVEPTQLIRTSIDFVTSGPIMLREGYIPNFLKVEEEADFILGTEGDR